MNTKSMYFAHRNPALGERFRPRWRRHAALAMSMPPLWDLIDRYAQYDPVDDPPPALGVTARYDAIGMSWFGDFEAFVALQDTDTMRRMRQDELEIFGRLVREVGFRGSETVLKDEGRGLFKIFSIIDRGEAVSQDGFPDRLNGLAADLLAAPGLGERLTRLAVCLPIGGSTSGRRNDGLLELSFDSLEDAAAFFGSDRYAEIAAAHRPAAIEVERCATREVLLDDRALYA